MCSNSSTEIFHTVLALIITEWHISYYNKLVSRYYYIQNYHHNTWQYVTSKYYIYTITLSHNILFIWQMAPYNKEYDFTKGGLLIKLQLVEHDTAFPHLTYLHLDHCHSSHAFAWLLWVFNHSWIGQFPCAFASFNCYLTASNCSPHVLAPPTSSFRR